MVIIIKHGQAGSLDTTVLHSKVVKKVIILAEVLHRYTASLLFVYIEGK